MSIIRGSLWRGTRTMHLTLNRGYKRRRIHKHRHRHRQTHTHTHTHTRTHTFTHTHTLTRPHTQIHTHNHTHEHTCIYTYTCTYTYASVLLRGWMAIIRPWYANTGEGMASPSALRPVAGAQSSSLVKAQLQSDSEWYEGSSLASVLVCAP